MLRFLAVIAGLLLLSRISLEALARRSALVAQLRFAVTMQDLRTVSLLRRQLNQESTRRNPWLRMRRSSASKSATGSGALTRAVRRRGWHGLLRFPATRLARITALAVVFGVLQAAVVRGTTPAVLASALVAFVIGSGSNPWPPFDASSYAAFRLAACLPDEMWA